MTDIIKIRLTAMIDNELKQINGMISNENLWMHGSDTEEDAQMHANNIADLEEYKELLYKMKSQVIMDEGIKV